MKLKDKLIELNEQKLDLINNVDIFQNRILLLRECFDWKINHLFRTLPPNITENLSNKFSNLQKDILKSVLFVNPDLQNIPDNSWLQSLLKFEHGGLNIQNIKLIRTSAYAASITQCLPTILDNINQLLSQEIDSLTQCLLPAKKPMMAIIGGSKVSTKLDLLYNLIDKV